MKTKNLAVGALVGGPHARAVVELPAEAEPPEASKVKAETAVDANRSSSRCKHSSRKRRPIRRTRATFKAQLPSLQQAVPNSPALAAFIRDANGIADASEISWQSVTHGPPAPDATGVSSIAVGIQHQGDLRAGDGLSRPARGRSSGWWWSTACSSPQRGDEPPARPSAARHPPDPSAGRRSSR